MDFQCLVLITTYCRGDGWISEQGVKSTDRKAYSRTEPRYEWWQYDPIELSLSHPKQIEVIYMCLVLITLPLLQWIRACHQAFLVPGLFWFIWSKNCFAEQLIGLSYLGCSFDRASMRGWISIKITFSLFLTCPPFSHAFYEVICSETSLHRSIEIRINHFTCCREGDLESTNGVG